jgi:hypothetical protein
MSAKTNVFMAAVVTICLLAIVRCKKDDPQPETERVKTLLKSNTWKLQSALVDGMDKTALYNGLTITFTDSNYTTTEGNVMWPASGSWSFSDDSATKIIRNDDLAISLEVTATTLKLSFAWSKSTLGRGRESSLEGQHLFTFTK